MHLPDGFLDVRTTLLSAGAAAVGVGIALQQVKKTLEPRRMPLLGLGAAFVFAAQMLNFPIAGGTSGHLLGGVLMAVLLGPGAAVVVMTCVLIVQCFVFSDGGLLSLGANILNLGLVTITGGYLVFRLIRKLFPMEFKRSTVFSAAFAAWFGTVLGSVSCAGQIASSGTAEWGLVFPAMANVHMLIGLGEGLATGLVLMAVLKLRPELVHGLGPEGRFAVNPVGTANETLRERWALFAYGVLIVIALMVFVAPYASLSPDGLESVARKLGFHTQGTQLFSGAPLKEYQLPGIGSATGATVLAGMVGAALAFIAAYGLARLLTPVVGTSKSDASS